MPSNLQTGFTFPPQQMPPQPPKFGVPHAPPSMTHVADTEGVPRYHKLDFPTFNGKDDPLVWLNRCEQFFWGQHTKEGYKVWLAAYHMIGAAQEWYIQLERDEGTPSWTRFKECCNLRFGPPIRTNPLGELARFKQTGSVADYVEMFQALLCRVDPLSVPQQVQIFTSGLTDRLRVDVELQNPSDL